MKKITLSHLGLLAIPLVFLGAVASVALASSGATTQLPVTTSITETATVQTAPTADTDTETNDDASVTSPKADTEAVDAPETKDDVSGPQEAFSTETAD